eukprot:6302265-Prorocentrum_lima.AAC.1
MASHTGDASWSLEMEHVGHVEPTMLAAKVAVALVDATWHNAVAAFAVASNLVAASIAVVACAAWTVAETP